MSDIPATIFSHVVPTEYDVEIHSIGIGKRVVLIDDRGRKFFGISIKHAFRRAEAAQDPTDPIHHPPYPDPAKTPLPR